MTRISSYSLDNNIGGNDKWIGSDAQNFLITKNFTPNNVANYFNGNNVIDIGTSIRYVYQTLNIGEQRRQGTISFETEIGPQVNFSAITTFLIAKNSIKQNDVSQYLDFLVDGKVLLSKASNINIFGYYKITSLQPWIPNTNFFVVTVDFLAGNGFIYEDLDYLISLVDKAQDVITPTLQSVVNAGNGISNFGGTGIASIQSTNFTSGRTLYLNDNSYPTIRLVDNGNASHNLTIDLDTINLNGTSYNWSTIVSGGTQNLQDVTDIGSITTNTITVGSFSGDFSQVLSNTIGTRNHTTGKYAYLDSSGYLGLDNGTVESYLKNTGVTNGNVILEFPNKPTGSYTIATLNDIPVITTPTLQEVTDAGAITTDSITVGEITSNYFIANDATNNSEMAPGYFVTTNAAATTFGILEFNQLVLGAPASSIKMTATGITFPNASIQVTAFPPTGGTSSQYIKGNGTLGTFPTTPTLQQVTDVGNTTTNEIVIGTDFSNGLTLNQGYVSLVETAATYIKQTGFGPGNFFTVIDLLPPGKSYSAGLSGDEGLYLNTFGEGGYIQLKSDLVTTAVRTIQFPDASGTIALTSDISPSPLTTKGDLYTYSTVDARLPVGLDTQVLLADSSTPTGLKWGTVAAITSLNSLTGATQTMVAGTSGTDFAVSSVGTTHTFNLPDASATARGVITTGAQTITGQKTFNPSVTAASAIARGTNLTPTLTAAANNDTLVGLDIAPTFTNGSFIGVNNLALRVKGDIFPSTNLLYNIGSSTSRFNYVFGFQSEFSYYYSPSGQNAFFGTSTNASINFPINNVVYGRFSATTGNLTLQNGGTFTDVASSRLTVNSTTQGFLPPRMTTTQRNAIASPATGLLVYDTTLLSEFQYNGTAWVSSISARRNANNSSNNNINYNGVAAYGSAEASAVWKITRLTIAASGSITIATATNVAWTNRESATYI